MANLIIVNEHDEIIGIKARNDKDRADITRVAGLLVYNSQNEMLIAQRSFQKIKDPGKWGPSVAGTVEEGETYVSNIIKEAREEIGLTIHEQDLKVLRHGYQETSHKYFSTLFSVVVDKPISYFIIQTEEVEAIRWIPIQELITWFEKKPEDFIASFSKTLEILRFKF